MTASKETEGIIGLVELNWIRNFWSLRIKINFLSSTIQNQDQIHSMIFAFICKNKKGCPVTDSLVVCNSNIKLVFII